MRSDLQSLLMLGLCTALLSIAATTTAPATAAAPPAPASAAPPTPVSSLVGSEILVEDAWIRWLPANLPAGGYMVLTNNGATTRVLTGASSPDFGEIGFHLTRVHNGMSDMTPVPTIELKPRVPVRFAPGSYHLMLMQSKRALRPGDRVLITLLFAEGPPIEVPFAVRAGNSQ
jgi:copper(I)-binding protein